MTTLPLFDLQERPSVSGMVHAHDPETSAEAAERIAPKRTELHQRVLDAFAQHGHMTDERLEQLPIFANYGPSTIRKRRSELYQQGALEIVGKEKNSRGQSMMVWRLR
jgi:hypothetical protein